MQIDKLSDNWLFQQHSKQTIREWVKQLRYFYFKRAWGGHANDGDEFQVAFSFTGRQDLSDKLGQLSLALNTIPDDFPRPVIGQSYPSTEFEKFKNEIKAYPNLEQPGHSTVFGHKTFIWVYDNSFQLSVSGTKDGNRYEVSDDDFKACLDLENHFDKLNWKNIVDNSLETDVCCISQTKYPELYGQETTVPNIGIANSGADGKSISIWSRIKHLFGA